jgi:hypothetical protein
MGAADSVRQIAGRVQGMTDDELAQTYRDVRRSPITQDNVEFVRRVESEYQTRKAIAEREERERREDADMRARLDAANAGIPPLDELDRRLREGAGKGES